jgi:hypothetical protein
MVSPLHHSEICLERPISWAIAAQATSRDWNGCTPDGSLSRLPPVLGLLYHNGAFVYHFEGAAATLFTVRTGDERIAPESLTWRKSLFVHHNIWK